MYSILYSHKNPTILAFVISQLWRKKIGIAVVYYRYYQIGKGMSKDQSPYNKHYYPDFPTQLDRF